MDYVGSVNSYDRESLHRVFLYKPEFGLKIYDELKYMLEYVCSYRLDIDIPNCLYGHKRFMKSRVGYLNETAQLSCPPDLQKKFERIEKSAGILAMLAMKMNQTGLQGEDDRRAFIKRVDSLKAIEEEAYTSYYERNCSVFENV